MMTKESIVQIIGRIERLEHAVFGKQPAASTRKATNRPENNTLDFSINIRAFVKRFATDKSGPKKFVLILAYLTKGTVGKNVALSEIRKQWEKMSAKTLLGKFNRFYPNEAKTQGWVDSKERGTYCLADGWKEVYE